MARERPKWALFGEMAMFTVEGHRTASAFCRGDAHLLAITYEQFEQLYFQNPEFGFYLVRLIVSRFQANLAQLEVLEAGAGRPPLAPPNGGDPSGGRPTRSHDHGRQGPRIPVEENLCP